MKKFPRTVQALGLLVALSAAAFAGGCSGDGGGQTQEEENKATVMDRFIIGKGMAYPADGNLRSQFPTLAASQIERRKAAWAIAQKVIAPVAIDSEGHALPRFQTWYAKEEIIPMYDRLLRGQSPEDRAARKAPTAEAIAEAFEWEATRAGTQPNFEERLRQRKAEIEADGPASLGGPEKVLMSPALVAHLYQNHDALLKCVGSVPGSDLAPPSDSNFAPCVGDEFPSDAVIVKVRWMPDLDPLPVYDMSAKSLTAQLGGESTWGDPARTAQPDDKSIYSMRLTNGIRMRQAAIHIASKELRDWIWISMFWSDEPTSDFGSDRPAEMKAEWGNYKMCVSVDFDEADDGAGHDAMDPTLRDALAATRAFGPRSWCSNPYLEGGAHNAKTNCIGCHQHGGTDNTSTTILEGPNAFPDGSRAKIRKNFPADYTFVTNSGLGLAGLMKAKYEVFVPPTTP